MKSSALTVALLLTISSLESTAETTNRSLSARQRLDPESLRAAHAAVERFTRERRDVPELNAYEDFRAVIHVHAEDAEHTKGTREQVLAGAKKAGVRVVLFTDHRGPRPETWHGLRDGVLFLAGSEDGDRKLRFPNFGPDRMPLPDGELKFLCHIEEQYEADTQGYDGMEIVNRHTDQKLDRGTEEYLATAAGNPETWRTVVEQFKAYPDEMFAAGTDYRAEIFAKWDRELKTRHLTGIGANDAHRNVIINGLTFDPYEVSFRNLCTHILARELTEPEIRHGLRDGHCYVSHDWLCDPAGFTFGAVNNLGVFPIGDTAPMQGTTRVVGITPLPARLKLFHAGKIVAQTNGTNLTFTASKPGAYRLEAWLEVAGEDRPWIYSNPVYLEEQNLLSMRLPNTVEPATVEMRKDIAYSSGKPEDEAKYKLNLFLPTGKTRAPVFFFVHGGAWRTGDRGLYAPLGYRMAKEGIVTVIPSYRLAPRNPHPAQIEDVAAAFAWTVKHIGELGGDTNRIYLGGHSAGGHLVSLLALDERFLQAHGLSPAIIKGVATMSGVYNLTIGESMSSVFGKNPSVRRDASPQFHIRQPAPPFLVTYCEWDYATLPFQAKAFHAALRGAGVASELLFTPRESHISEIIAFTHDDDATAAAVLKFVLSPLLSR